MVLAHGFYHFKLFTLFFTLLIPTHTFYKRTTHVHFCVAAMGVHQCIRMYASSLVRTALCVLLYVCYYIAANAVAAIASIVATAKALMLLLLFFPKYHLTPDLP